MSDVDSQSTKPRGLPRAEALYTALATLFCVVLVLTNIVGVKLFELFESGRPAWIPGEGPMTLTTGIITYPITFLCTDLVAEIWGKRRANLMVWLGFGMSILMLGIVRVAMGLSPSDFWANSDLGLDAAAMQSAFEVTFQFPALLLLASMSAYLVAQLVDVRLYHFWWRVTGGRHMWIRNNGSTMISQLLDTGIVNGIFLPLAFDMSWPDVGAIIAAQYVCKLLLAVVDTPLVYLGRSLIRSFLGLPAGAAGDSAPLA
ncbi:MAG: putative integral membrane protein (TIGR00697 family) [Planctomycetota bacterium]|jgi:uncharacterized integral membrane protein (TIGR00697 family)